MRPANRTPTRTIGAGTAALIAFAAAAAAAGLGRSVMTSYLPVLLDRVESAPGLIGTALLVNAAAGFVVPLAVGVWSDRRGTRLPFITMGAVLSVAGLGGVALGAGSSIIMLTALAGVAYIGINAITTAHRALVPDLFSVGERARATGMQEALMMAATLLGVVIGGVTIEIASWAPFALAAVVVPLLTVPTLLKVREPAGAASQPGQAAPRRRTEHPLRYYARASARPGVRALLLAQILWVLGYAATPAFFILYAEKVLEMSPARASLFLGGFGIASGVAMLAAGRIKDPSRYGPLLAFGVVLMSGGFLGVAATTNLLAMTPALIAGAVGFGLLSTLGFPLLTTLVPEGEQGGYTALYFSVRSIASAIALPAAGWMIALTGSYRTLFWAGGAATLLALLPLAWAISINRTAWPRPRLLEGRFSIPRPRWVGRWAASIAAVWVVVVAAGILILQTPLVKLDQQAFHAVDAIGSWPPIVFEILDPHTRNYMMIVLLGLVLALAFRRRAAIAMVAMFVVADVIAGAMLLMTKPVFDRARPEEVLDVATAGGTWSHLVSFPSGHMVVTAALVSVVAFVIPRARPWMWGYLAAIAFSRVWFGAHFPFDVLAGAFIGYAAARASYALALRTGLLTGPAGAYEDALDADSAAQPVTAAKRALEAV